jgi:hypothetical protein
MIRKNGYPVFPRDKPETLPGDHAQTKRWSEMTIRRKVITLWLMAQANRKPIVEMIDPLYDVASVFGDWIFPAMHRSDRSPRAARGQSEN